MNISWLQLKAQISEAGSHLFVVFHVPQIHTPTYIYI